jgi:cell wall-associated NlpC family hydrolase
MSFDGIAAVQARIQAIEQQLAGVSATSATAATAAAPTAAGTSTSTDFASMLSSALGTQAATGSTDLSSLSSLMGTGAAGGTTGTPDLSTLLAQVSGAQAGSTTGLQSVGASANPIATQFVSTALSQSGKPYVWASSASASDPNPVSFDCSELTKWAAARSGVTIPDGAAHQYVWLKEQGATMSVQQALQTPGALLFSFADEPQPGLAGEPAHAHVAISLGNGKTIEAKGHAYGVGVFDAGNRFNYAGMIPGMS